MTPNSDDVASIKFSAGCCDTHSIHTACVAKTGRVTSTTCVRSCSCLGPGESDIIRASTWRPCDVRNPDFRALRISHVWQRSAVKWVALA